MGIFVSPDVSLPALCLCVRVLVYVQTPLAGAHVLVCALAGVLACVCSDRCVEVCLYS